jgi:hypothetical protein
VLQWAVVPFWGLRSPRDWIFEGEFTVWVPVLLNLYTEFIIFTKACLSYVRAITVFMLVSLGRATMSSGDGLGSST